MCWYFEYIWYISMKYPLEVLLLLTFNILSFIPVCCFVITSATNSTSSWSLHSSQIFILFYSILSFMMCEWRHVRIWCNGIECIVIPPIQWTNVLIDKCEMYCLCHNEKSEFFYKPRPKAFASHIHRMWKNEKKKKKKKNVKKKS